MNYKGGKRRRLSQYVNANLTFKSLLYKKKSIPLQGLIFKFDLTMKKILFLSTALLLAVSLLFTSCGDKENEEPEVPIVGTWLVQSQKLKIKIKTSINLDQIPPIGSVNVGDVIKQFEQDTTISPEAGVEETYKFTSKDSLIMKTSSEQEVNVSKATYKRSGKKLTIIDNGISLPFDITTLTDTDLKYQFVKSMTLVEAIDFALSQGMFDALEAATIKEEIKPYETFLSLIKIDVETVFSFTKK